MVKILYIHHGRVIGGAPVSLRNMIKGILFETDEYEITVACIYNEMMDFFKKIPNVKVKKYPGSLMFVGRILSGHSDLKFNNIGLFTQELFSLKRSVKAEIEFIKAEKPNIVHLNSVILMSTAISASRLGIPIVWHVREATKRYCLRRWLYSKYMKYVSKKIICIGIEEFRGIGGFNNKKIELINNSLDDCFFMDNNSAGLENSAFRSISLGGSSLLKGAYQLIKSLRFLPEETTLILVGTPPEKLTRVPGLLMRTLFKFEDILIAFGAKTKHTFFYMIRLSQELKKTDPDRYELVGEVDDVREWIHKSNVLVFAGTTSHSGRPIYEAWALKKPVVVFDSQAVRHDIEDGEDGIILKEKTAEKIAEAVLYLKNNPEKARKMGEAGYLKAKERFSLASNTVKIINVYREILGEDSI